MQHYLEYKGKKYRAVLIDYWNNKAELELFTSQGDDEVRDWMEVKLSDCKLIK